MPKKYIDLGDGRRTLDLTGQKYNRLTFVSYEGRYRTSAVWICRCDCGESITTTSNNVKSGNTKHCGCLSSPSAKKTRQKSYYHKDAKIITICNIIGWSKEFVQSKDFKPYVEKWWKSKRRKYYPWMCQCGCGSKIKIKKEHIDKFVPLYIQDHGATYRKAGECEDLTGQKYNHLTFIEFVERTETRTLWKCLCDCEEGKYTITDANSVKRGTTTSCGCVRKEMHEIPITDEHDTGWWQIDFDVKPRRDTNGHRTLYWALCTHCGLTKKWVDSYYIRYGLSRSCGCINEEYRKAYKSGPRFNPAACRIIGEYGSQNGYSFRHAMNGGEAKVLKYYVDGYDPNQNVVIEVDEDHHYKRGQLRKSDIRRQRRIMRYLGCTFIRIRVDNFGNVIGEPRIYLPTEIPEIYPNHGIISMAA